MKEEEQDPTEFEQLQFDQGKCRHHLIILNLYINIIYFSCMCPINANPKDLTSISSHSLCTWGYDYG
jgi:hypothetical protein